MPKDKILTPESLWAYFLEYVEWVKANPILVQDYVGKDGKEVDRKRQRPLTIEGFMRWLKEKQVISGLHQYLANTDNRFEDFKETVQDIRAWVRADQIEGGMANIYNHNITARLNNLTDKTEQITVQIPPMFPDVQKNDSDQQSITA